MKLPKKTNRYLDQLFACTYFRKKVYAWGHAMILVKNLLKGNECVRVRKELLYDGNYVV